MDADTKINLVLKELKNIVNTIENNFNRFENRFDKFASNSNENHEQFSKNINNLDNLFLRLEVENKDKLKTLSLDTENCINHQLIYNRKFRNLDDIIKKHSYRISALEKVNN